MFLLSSADVAIRAALELGTLRVTEHTGRFGLYFAISDDCGLIEVATTAAAVQERLAAFR